MSAYPRLAQAVRSVLKTKARVGQTTKGDATILVMKRIDGVGGPTKYGIGAAAMRMALSHIIQVEVTRQFKEGISDHAREFILPPTVPADLMQSFGRIPQWFAIEEGRDALWMYALKATPEHWEANWALKEKKGKQTLVAANLPLEISLFLKKNGFRSLEDVLRK